MPTCVLDSIEKGKGGGGPGNHAFPPAVMGDLSVPLRRLAVACLALGMVMAGFPVASQDRGGEKHRSPNEMRGRTVDQVQEKYQDRWMRIPGVMGVAIGGTMEKPLIKVLVVKKTRALEQKIPQEAEGYPVVIEETGEIRALPLK